jgi:hypothetical protein
VVVKTNLCTIVCVYFQPEFKADEIIDQISHILQLTNNDEAVMLAGDLNCQIDAPQQKSIEVTNYLEEEGLSLVNSNKVETYVCHNRTSTINLVFINPKPKVVKQEVILNPQRKHLPVATMLQLNTELKTNPKSQNVSRKINTSALQNEDIMDTLQSVDLNGVAVKLQQTLQTATVPAVNTQRKAKPWFTSNCFAARKAALEALHALRRHNSLENLQGYHNKRKQYKAIIKEA